ncbi:Abnormal spindle-like microcephaly-associated [Phytophthora citrophthora]|uniref:Abnormal spindle-like microcephaly-associated n=1 Tax=Phytophthora citrophthora TaxID=4793 RepID=A0AAD9LND7_9STRA|nr:Abnormal spindle-like microcephaly-associated [Phytophthora citrophthora]
MSWDKSAVTRRPQLAQLPSGSLSAPKKLQLQNGSLNQLPTQSFRKASPGVRLNRGTSKRVTKVPKLAFNQTSGKRRGRNASSNQFSLDGEARQVNAGVYLLENVKTGHRYFGTTWDLQNAAAQSFHDLQLAVHPHQALSTCFKLYGEAASGIRFRVLEHVSPPSSPQPPSRDQNSVKRRRIKRRADENNNDSFDVRAMERKLAARLRFHQRKTVRHVAYKLVRRFLVVPVLARAWPQWVRVTEGLTTCERVAASVEIQRAARGYLARILVTGIRREHAVRILQQFMRRCHFTLACRRRARVLREAKAAGVIQRSMREFVACRMARRRQEGVRRWLAARKLQAYIRGHLARCLVRRMRLDKLRVHAAMDIQRTARGHLTRLQLQRQRQQVTDRRAAIQIQKVWRGYSTRVKVTLGRLGVLSTHRRPDQRPLDELRDDAARTIQQCYARWQARRLKEQNDKATTIRMAYRNYVARKFGWVALTVLLETSMANRIQRAARRWMFQRSFRLVVKEYRREKAALTIQCFVRQGQARRKVHVLRVKKRCAQAIRRIQTFWRACWMLLKLRERILTRKRECAAKQIQTTYRAWVARREYLAIRDLARRNGAAIKLQCLFRARQARRELLRRQVVRKLGACENCRSQLATVYHFEAESELCAACCDSFASLGESIVETLDVNVYRRILVRLVSAQRAYRAFQRRMQLQFGTCTLCEKHAVRRSCWSCGLGQTGKPVGLTFCRSCDALFHGRTGALLQHQRKNIEHAYAEIAASVTIQKYYRRFAQRHTLTDLQVARQTAAAKRVQECYRRHRQRRITRAICAAHRQQQVFEVSAALTIQRAVRRHLARCEFRRLKLERNSAVKIQRVFRRYQVRREYYAAVVIQRNVRGWLARRIVDALRCEKLERQLNAAACCIQRHVRGFLARRRVLHIRQYNAAVSLQTTWRGYVARCKLRTLKLEKQRKFAQDLHDRLNSLAAEIAERARVSVTRIQTAVRGRQARDELHNRKLHAARDARVLLRDAFVALEVSSATCIQRHVRERITDLSGRLRLRAQCCARCFLSRRTVTRMRLEKRSAVRIQRAFRYSRAKRRLARLVDEDVAEIAKPAGWVELFDEESGCVYYYHTETGESVWERPPEMDAPTWTPEDAAGESVGEWVEYWDENVGTSYFYNVKTGEAKWTTPAGYTSSNQEETSTAEAWPLENGGTYFTLPSRSRLEASTEAGNQQMEDYADQYYDYNGEQAAWGDDGYNGDANGEGGYYYYGEDAGEQFEPVDTEYDINYKIYLTQMQQQHEETDDLQDPKDA